MARFERTRYPLAVVGLVLTTFLLRGTVHRLFTDAVHTGFPVWAPTFGSVGQTVIVYQWALTGFVVLFVPAAAFWLGTRYEQEASTTRER